ncbi:hypothetical protein, partial [Escherichia coli]|uniref:hypothetical protein n=1 Tax=Escherichia coli TaxID=562 RepID=UPI003F792934
SAPHPSISIKNALLCGAFDLTRLHTCLHTSFGLTVISIGGKIWGKDPSQKNDVQKVNIFGKKYDYVHFLNIFVDI